MSGMMSGNFLAQCEREPLQHSGTLQPHGTLLVTTADGVITHHAANLAAWLDEASGLVTSAALPPHLQQLIAALPEGERHVLPAALEGPQGLLDLVVSRTPAGALTLEFMRHQEPAPALRARSAIALRGPYHDEIDQLADMQALVDLIGELTGFQRVMYYRFLDNDDGEVITEYRRDADCGSYLAHRFPASDIPQIARTLYLLNPWRLIPDAKASPASLLGPGGAPDLTRSDLRGVAPVHVEYLANMGVSASLSFPVLVNGALVALLACHDITPRLPALADLEAASREVRSHALALTLFQAQLRMRLIDRIEYRFNAARNILQRHGDMLAAWSELGPLLIKEFACDRAILSLEQNRMGAEVDDDASIEAITAHLDNRRDTPLWLSENLSIEVPDYPFSALAGALVVRGHTRLNREFRVLLMRGQQTQEIIWGGNPRKPVEYHTGQLVISPRRSFEKWVEKRLGYCRPWDSEARLLGFKLRELLSQQA